MRRSFALPVLFLLAAVLVAGEVRKEKRGSEKPQPGEKGKASKDVSLFDVDEFFKRHDRNEDSFLSKEELPEQFRHAFGRIDTNRDGKISKEELRKGVGYLHPRRRPSDVVYVLVETSDCDECCAEELQTLYALLRKMDKNGDGKIDGGEIKAAREALTGERVDRIFKALDANKDGKISREEARGQIKRYFDELDANKDGAIDRAELLRGASEKPRKLPPRKSGTPPPGGKPSDRPRGR